MVLKGLAYGTLSDGTVTRGRPRSLIGKHEPSFFDLGPSPIDRGPS